MMIQNILLVACGGMAGTISRFLISQAVFRDVPGSFPTGTFFVNLTGCLAIGVLWGLQSRVGWMTKEWELFLMMGFCGGYTTFSAFSLENIRLLQSGHISLACAYAVLSVAFGITLTFLGYVVVRNA